MGVTDAELELFRRESGLRTDAQNANSTAKGIWQGLKSTRIAYASMHGFDPETLDGGEQTTMARSYIIKNYGTAERALAFQIATTSGDASLAPEGLRAKAEDWIAKGYRGY